MRRAWTWGTEIYFVQESGIGAIKIGIAANVQTRVSGMSSCTPHTLTVLATIDGDRRLEDELHSRFASARIRGEWFRPVPELLAYIEKAKQLPKINRAYEAAVVVSGLIPSKAAKLASKAGEIRDPEALLALIPEEPKRPRPRRGAS